MASLWKPRIRSGQKVARLMLFTIAPDEDKEALAGCNDVAASKARVVHGPLVSSFGVLLVCRQRIRLPRPRVADELLGSAASVLHAPPPLLDRKRRVGKVFQLLREADLTERNDPQERSFCTASEKAFCRRRSSCST
jgi:hypothetical protein